jgi:hypothetical protein
VEDGLVTAHELGDVTITATSQGTPGTADVTVQPVPVDGITLSQNVIVLTEGSSVELTATVTAGGEVVTDREVTWTTEDGAVASVSPLSGLMTVVTGEGAGGPISVTATSEGVSASASVTVQPNTPQPDQYEPNSQGSPASLGQIQIGQTRVFSANFHDHVNDSEDWYTIDAALSHSPSCSAGDIFTLTVTMDNLPPLSDYDLYLYDGTGTQELDRGYLTGTVPETVSGQRVLFCDEDLVQAFQVRVAYWTGADTNDMYTLTVTLTAD